MPNLANITVKDAANADVVYNGVVPSAGDRSPARFQAIAASPIAGNRPTLSVLTRDNGNKDGRVLEASFRFPITATDPNGTVRTVAVVPMQVHGTLPTNVDASKVADAYVQFAGLMASALLKAVAADGYAPT